MSCEAIITASRLSKRYPIYAQPQDRLKQSLFGRWRQYHREFWALKDISFSIAAGEVVGIIGRNGSGKSTLLQLIAGTLTPTAGELAVNGQVAALLELGSGFNPEFTGRENIFLNGAILGLSQRDVERYLQDIVAFADIGDFLDQPVKTYSSGMAVRLAFAVQAFVPKDILIVDEALAVGDELFQRKCFAKIEEFKRHGGTILFVSHASAAVIQLCDRALLLHAGELVLSGLSTHVVNMYHKFLYAPPERQAVLLAEMRQEGVRTHRDSTGYVARQSQTMMTNDASLELPLLPAEKRSRDRKAFYDPALQSVSTVHYESRGARIGEAMLVTEAEERVNVLVARGLYVWRYHVTFDRDCYNVRCGMLIKTLTGIELGGATTAPGFQGIPHVAAGTTLTVEFTFTANLTAGTYFLNAGVLGMVDDAEVYLDRKVELGVCKILPEENALTTAVVDFHITPHVRLHSDAVSSK
jgi:lipopolysaccharide transport system ATP-binding protein